MGVTRLLLLGLFKPYRPKGAKHYVHDIIFFIFKVGMIGILASMVDLKQWRREIGLIIPRIAMAKILNALLKLL